MSSLQGISVRLPLAYSKEDGPYGLNKNIGQVVKQNFKNLVLTSPGERPMGINEVMVSIKYNLGSIDSSDTLEISPIND